MSAIPAPKYVSVEVYLLMEEQSDEKHEYYQGKVFAMAGGTIPHNQIVSNTLGEINSFCNYSGCYKHFCNYLS